MGSGVGLNYLSGCSDRIERSNKNQKGNEESPAVESSYMCKRGGPYVRGASFPS